MAPGTAMATHHFDYPGDFSNRLRLAYDDLYARFGPQDWWPGETPFEVMIGAILTQNTAWSNVEKAIARLQERELLEASALIAVPVDRLADAIRPAGYFNVKAKRMRAFCQAYVAAGGWDTLQGVGTAELRAWLLAINGVGPETADDILLYAFGRPVFVIDAYTRRIFSRMGLIAGDEPYEALRQRIESALGLDAALFNEYHALLVRLAKEACRARPWCDRCPLAGERVACPGRH
jgi:endonuclease-3 related protein